MWTASVSRRRHAARKRRCAGAGVRWTATGVLLAAGAGTGAGGGLPTGGGNGLVAQEHAQEHELRQWDVVRVTGATVLRGGPASPARLFPVALEGRVAGMRGDTLLFETGNEPVYWIPLSVGPPLVERRAQVADRTRLMLVASAVAGAAGATFAWGLHDGCGNRPSTLSAGCSEGGSAGRAALGGFVAGAAVGAAAGFVLNRFARRRGWTPLPVGAIRYRPWPTTTDDLVLRPDRGGGRRLPPGPRR